MNHLLTVLMIGMMLSLACRNECAIPTDPTCSNYDPCWNQTEVSADFRIIENGSVGLLEVYDTVYYDTVFSYNLITEAVHVHADWDYTWHIGSEKYKDIQTSLDYTHVPLGVPIPLTLIVEGPPNTSCFPNDDGKDTLTRYIVRDHRQADTMVYKGYRNEEVDDSLTITFYYDVRSGQTRLKGLTDHCDGPVSQYAATKRTLIGKDPSIGCDLAIIRLIHDPEKTGEFDQVFAIYSLADIGASSSPLPRTEYTFKGRRIK